MALVHRARHAVDGGALEEILLGGWVAREDRVHRGGELGEVRPLAAGEVGPVDDRVRVDVRGLQVLGDAVERAGDQLLGGRLVDVLVDDDLEGGGSGRVLRLRRQELVRELGREDRAADRRDGEDEDERKPSQCHLLSL